MIASNLVFVILGIAINSEQHFIHNENLRYRPHGHNPNAAYIAKHSPYKNLNEPDFSHHLDEQWTFLDEEPELTLSDVINKEPGDTYEVVYDLMKRVLGSKSYLTSQFILELIVSEENRNPPSFLSKEKHSNHPFWSKGLDLDVMELDNNGTNGIILRGSSTIALIVAFNWYLEEYCNTTYDWRTYTLELPSTLPLPPYKKNIRTVPFSYYENVCTVSYTQAFWGWSEWETHLDWMAMVGINLPLAFTGQEYIWSKTFNRFNFTQQDLQAFFSGPGFFAWQRMGNLRGWGGPITQDCIMDQYNLQIQILARMNSFGMIPALTAFAGHVPYAITKYYPDADVEPSPNWWGSSKQYCCDLLLNFTDPLFVQIGSAFIEEQTKYFGTGHIYQCDSFNEMDPPTNSTEYLNASSASIYNAMNIADENAVWLMQGWLFQYHGYWKPAQVKAYLDGVANDGLIILDLYDDVSPQYNNFDSFYEHPFVWNTLHNFGGNQGILGTLYNIAVGLGEALKYPNSTVIGVGTTMEGIWQNYIVYDLTYKMAFAIDPPLDEFVDKYAIRRYGLPYSVDTADQNMVVSTMQKAWLQLKNTVYNISHWGGVTKNMMCISPTIDHAVHSGFMPTELLYDPVVIQQVWQMFLSVSNTKIANIEKYRYDLIDITRQSLSDLFEVNYIAMNSSFTMKNLDDLKKYGTIMIDLMTDLDILLNTNKNWMLGEWIAMAKSHSSDNETEQLWWEWNARNQVSLWGPQGEISNYASKQWAGLIGDYHKPQWQLFVNQLIDSVENNKPFNQAAFTETNMNTIEQPWQHATNSYPVNPINDTITVACDLFVKWNTLNDTTTCTN